MRKWILAGVFLLGFLLRVVGIDKIPTGFSPDEASFGYDAYSILKTGKDQWGHPFPLVLESFGDFKSPLYAYLTIPSVAVFGLTKFAVRLPNAILGAMAVIVVWLLASRLVNKKVGLIAALLLAVSPWHIMMSRGAFEANLITFFLPLGIYLFLKQKYNLSAIVFGLSLFSYHSPKLIAPIVFLALLLIFRVKKLVPIALFASAFVLMLYANSLGGGERIAERSITVGALEEGAKAKIELIQKGANPIVARFLHNKYQVTAKRFLDNYVQYFSPKFLFTEGPAETTYGMIPGIGVVYIFEGFLLLGLAPLALDRKVRRAILLTAGWLLIAPVPAALSTGVGYAGNRAASMIPALQILFAFGAYGLARWLQKYDRRWMGLVATALSLVVVATLVNAGKKYFIESAKTSSRGMLYGNLEVASWLKEDKGERKVVVSTRLSEPHIYIAFANSWEPKDYQKQTMRWNYKDSGVSWVDQMSSYTLGDYIFQSVDWKKNTGKPNTLLVGRPGEFLESVIPEKIIYYPDGTEAIYVVDSEKQSYAKVN